jgi:UDP:flavonoid glycosyltransferase YjiC (YdhE family)
MERKRILFLAEGITMTHFVRPLVLAQALDPSEWDVSFWAPRRYHSWVHQPRWRLGTLETIGHDQFLRSLASGARLHSRETLTRYVRDDTAIMRETRPDLVVGDFRPSLCISAPLNGVPFASVFNAYWSPHREQPAIVPTLPLTRWISPRLLAPLFSALRPFVYSYHAKPVNDVRRAFGLPRLSNDLRVVYTAGDLTLYPDVPELVPLTRPPRSHHFVGPCAWEAPAPKPPWWNRVMDDPKPKIFVSMGSSGDVDVISAVLEAASACDVNVILGTSGREIGRIGTHVNVAELLPFEETARRSAVVVSHGGAGALYPTLSAGTPMLAIPGNIDSHLSADLLAHSGAGLIVRAERASVRLLSQSIKRLIDEPRFKTRAAEWRVVMKASDTQRLFPDVLRAWFSERAASS